jgi:mRNA interferase RelE/StbE
VPTPNLSRKALDFIKKMQHKHAKQVLLKILELCGNPVPPDSQKLEGSSEGYRRVDAGEYRIIYRLLGDQLEVFLVGKRNDDDVYKQFSRR